MAAIEDQLVRPPRIQVRRRRKIRERPAIARPGARQRQVSVETPRLRLQPSPHALGLDVRGERSDMLGA